MFDGISSGSILTLAAPSQRVAPEGLKPVNPSPVRMAAPYIRNQGVSSMNSYDSTSLQFTSVKVQIA